MGYRGGPRIVEEDQKIKYNEPGYVTVGQQIRDKCKQRLIPVKKRDCRGCPVSVSVCCRVEEEN